MGDLLSNAWGGLQKLGNNWRSGMDILGRVGNGMSAASGQAPAYKPKQPGLAGLQNDFSKFRTKPKSTDIGRSGPDLTQGGGIGQPGAQAGTLFGSMGPARSSTPRY